MYVKDDDEYLINKLKYALTQSIKQARRMARSIARDRQRETWLPSELRETNRILKQLRNVK